MPLAEITMIEGRTEDQKRAVIEKVTQALVEAVGRADPDRPRRHPRGAEDELGYRRRFGKGSGTLSRPWPTGTASGPSEAADG
jgi:hypothetical protein